MNELFNKQKAFQAQLENDVMSMSYLRTQSLALIVELGEFLNETPWKPWKKNKHLDVFKAREELIDCWHFMINISLPFFNDFDDLKKAFNKKHDVNNKRQEENY